MRRFPDLIEKLIGHGRPAGTPIAIVERGTTREQRIIRGTLGQLTLLAEAHRVEAPAMLFIGDVARLGLCTNHDQGTVTLTQSLPGYRRGVGQG